MWAKEMASTFLPRAPLPGELETLGRVPWDAAIKFSNSRIASEASREQNATTTLPQLARALEVAVEQLSAAWEGDCDTNDCRLTLEEIARELALVPSVQDAVSQATQNEGVGE